MVSEYLSICQEYHLASDLAAEHPLYLYWPKDKSTLLYSQSITELLDDSRVPKPLAISNEGVSFLLQSGVVPPPKTAYEDIYILGIGDQAKVSTQNGKVEVEFTHEFPFLNGNRLSPGEMEPDEDKILEMLAEATISRIDPSRPSFLFHSAGKDSNSIALALAEAGWQDKVTLITHKSKGKVDESEISAKIAKQLGFRHQVLHEVDKLRSEHKQAIHDYFVNAPFPCTDNVTLAYPLYACQIPELKGANVIDGGGNDSHMTTPPTTRDLKAMPFAKFAHNASVLRNLVKSESVMTPMLRTPAEWCGMSGFSLGDTKKIFSGASNVYGHWKHESLARADWDLFDLKTSVYSSVTIAEMHMRKARNFSDSINSNLVLPFAHEGIAKYFQQLPEKHLFDRTTLKNKLILRKILKDRLGLDSDELGKLGFSYDSRSVVLQNWDDITHEIYACELWSQAGVREVVQRLRKRMDGKGWGAGTSGRLLYKLYVLSCWVNKNRWINPITAS
ncbi:hypothetical protein [Marinobacter piscensis]|uniref:hypothetical protein n=1 Tax=Marinobacter piscensis TaxID=1562308 RepID=UPI0011A6E178|nr:hypothetical protein [Marinobacter piscensis]